MFRSKGFTIVELLVVIVVIAILASITVVAYNGIQQRAKATAIADGFRKIEKAFQLYAISDGLTTWPQYANNPSINTLISTTNLGNYIQDSPDVPGIAQGRWAFDNDGDAYPPSCTDSTPGANAYISGDPVDTDLAQRVDDILDDGVNDCGKVRWKTNGDDLRIIIGLTQNVN